MPDESFSYGPIKQQVIDLYWRFDDLMKSKKPFTPQEVQTLNWDQGFIFALMLVCDGQAEYDLPSVLKDLEERLGEYGS